MRQIAQPTQCTNAHRGPCPQESIRPHWVDDILREVAAEHRIALRQIIPDRDAKSVFARSDAMRRIRARKLANGKPHSYPTIARWFGRHHTTVMNACGALQK